MHGYDLNEVLRSKYGDLSQLGWGPRNRIEHGYFVPAEVYEAAVAAHVFPGCEWIDVGGGHNIFPQNPTLARSLVAKCRRVVAVDPDATIENNAFVHEQVRIRIEDFNGPGAFDLATLRMVAEHIEHPEVVVRKLSELVRRDGVVVVFTVYLWSPVTILSRLLPFRFHHRVKKVFWGGEEEDTFPVQYKMNTRMTLRRLFERFGFIEARFDYLDDLSVFSQNRLLNYLDLKVWGALKALGLSYPETCLLGVYKRL